MKAFRRGDFRFFDDKGILITDLGSQASAVHRLEITWRVQKNRRNGQKISWVINTDQPHLCPVQAAIRIVLRSISLGLSDAMPLGCYIKSNKTSSSVVYLTGHAMTQVLRSVAREALPFATEEEIRCFSPHMFRVTACVLLQQAGMSSDYIKTRLRWASEAYQVYLRDTLTLAEQHVDAANLPSNVVPQLAAVARDMGTYVDFNA